MKVDLNKNVLNLEENNQKMNIFVEKDNICFISNDIYGLTIKENTELWMIFNNLFNELQNIENNKLLNKYQEYLLRISSEINYSKIVIAKSFNDFIISIISPKDKIVKINYKKNEIGNILFNLYNTLEMHTKGMRQLSMNEYVYTLTKKNVKY